MRRVRLSVAMSLDGFIAGPRGESDWIVMDPDIDFRRCSRNAGSRHDGGTEDEPQ